MERNPLEQASTNGWNIMSGLSKDISQTKLEVCTNLEANRWRNEHQIYEQDKRIPEIKSPVKDVEKGSFLHFFAGG